jgi:hypothetical protein
MGNYMKLKVFGDIVPVKKCKHLESDGLYMTKEKMILINSDLVGADYNEAVLHELFEAVYFRCSFYQSLNSELKEVLFDCLAKAIVENFKITCK